MQTNLAGTSKKKNGNKSGRYFQIKDFAKGKPF